MPISWLILAGLLPAVLWGQGELPPAFQAGGLQLSAAVHAGLGGEARGGFSGQGGLRLRAGYFPANRLDAGR
jgi:hypothetical protein